MMMTQVRYKARMGKDKCIYSFSLGPQRKRPLGRPRHGWKDDSDSKDVIRNIDTGDDYDTAKAIPIQAYYRP